MSIDIAAEIKFSLVTKGEYTVSLRDADETLIGSVRRTASGWNAYDLENRPQGGNGTTREMAAAHVLKAYELANGLRDSEGRRVTKEPLSGLWFVADFRGVRESSRWTDKADAIAHLASLQVVEEQAAEEDAQEDDGFKLGVVAPADWDRYDHRCCIEAGEHRGYTRHTKAECRVEDDVNPVGEDLNEPVEFSDRACYVTEQVSLWIQNDGEHIEEVRGVLRRFGTAGQGVVGGGDFGGRITEILKAAPKYSAPWHVAQELAPNDWNRIHWDQVAEALRDQENEEAYDMPLTGQDTTFYHDDGMSDPGTPGGGALPH